jgi:hypothetical protein
MRFVRNKAPMRQGGTQEKESSEGCGSETIVACRDRLVLAVEKTYRTSHREGKKRKRDIDAEMDSTQSHISAHQPQ